MSATVRPYLFYDTAVSICGERLIPFDTYNLFYRDQLEQTRLTPLRARALATA